MSLRGRVIWVGAIVVLAAVLAVPSFYSPEERRESPWVADNGLNLGLDLQGGVHWLLRIDTSTAVRQELERTESVLREILEVRGATVPEIEILDTGAIQVEGSPDEVRALWVDAYHEGIKSPQQIDELVETAQAGNLNALVVQPLIMKPGSHA